MRSRDGVLSTDPEMHVSPESGGNDQSQVEIGQTRRPSELTLAEAVIAPGSRMIGRRIEQVGLHAETGCIVLGIQRRSRMIRMPDERNQA